MDSSPVSPFNDAMRPVRLAVVFLLLGLAGCNRRDRATPLAQDDGKSKTTECAFAVDAPIAKDRTIAPKCLVKIATPVTVTAGATLRIGAGARLVFEKGARLVVADGALVTEGTKLDPVVFTSSATKPEPGDWGGLSFWSSKPSSLTGAVVEYAGEAPIAPPVPAADASALTAAKGALVSYAPLFGMGPPAEDDHAPVADRRPAIFVARDAKLSLVDVVVRHAARVGLAADGDEPFERFEGNRFEATGGFAMDVIAHALGKVSSIAASEPVRVRGKVHATQTWPLVRPAIVVGSLWVASDVTGGAAVLMLAPEQEIRVQPKASLRFGSYDEGGAIVAKKVRFTSAAEKLAPGDWAGIRFGRRAPGTVVEDCVVEFTGWEPTPKSASKPSPKPGSPAPKPPAITIVEAMKDFRITKTTFRHNAGPGIARADSYSGFAIGTGGCEGLDAKAHGNQSIGQPLCEYHEDPMKGLMGLGDGPSTLGVLKGSSADIGDAFGAGGLGVTGIGLGGGGKDGGGGGAAAGPLTPGLGGIGYGSKGGTGKAGGSGAAP